MSKLVALFVLASTFAPTLAAAEPATMWNLDFKADDFQNKKRGPDVFVLRPNGSVPTWSTYQDAAKAVDTKVQKGEWVIDGLWADKQDEDLRARVFKRGGVLVPWDAVIGATIVDAKFQVDLPEYTDGFAPSYKVELVNKSPYTLRVNQLTFTSCVKTGFTALAKPIEIAPNATKRVDVTVARTEFPRQQFIACPFTTGWHETVLVEFRAGRP
jgi:hypothetical protein